MYYVNLGVEKLKAGAAWSVPSLTAAAFGSLTTVTTSALSQPTKNLLARIPHDVGQKIITYFPSDSILSNKEAFAGVAFISLAYRSLIELGEYLVRKDKIEATRLWDVKDRRVPIADLVEKKEYKAGDIEVVKNNPLLTLNRSGKIIHITAFGLATVVTALAASALKKGMEVFTKEALLQVSKQVLAFGAVAFIGSKLSDKVMAAYASWKEDRFVALNNKLIGKLNEITQVPKLADEVVNPLADAVQQAQQAVQAAKEQVKDREDELIDKAVKAALAEKIPHIEDGMPIEVLTAMLRGINHQIEGLKLAKEMNGKLEDREYNESIGLGKQKSTLEDIIAPKADPTLIKLQEKVKEEEAKLALAERNLNNANANEIGFQKIMGLFVQVKALKLEQECLDKNPGLTAEMRANRDAQQKLIDEKYKKLQKEILV